LDEDNTDEDEQQQGDAAATDAGAKRPQHDWRRGES
jgi:hypothetical protein